MFALSPEFTLPGGSNKDLGRSRVTGCSQCFGDFAGQPSPRIAVPGCTIQRQRQGVDRSRIRDLLQCLRRRLSTVVGVGLKLSKQLGNGTHVTEIAERYQYPRFIQLLANLQCCDRSLVSEFDKSVTDRLPHPVVELFDFHR